MTDTALDPQDIARAVAIEVADEPEHVGGFVTAVPLDDHVTDYRFQSNVRGYEGWQWSVTLYHDEELDNWTVNESSLVPTDQALMPPAWIPWKDRLEPTDLSPTDAIGTEPDDPRLEAGVVESEADAAGGDVVSDGTAGAGGEAAESGDASANGGDGSFRATEPAAGGESADGVEPSGDAESMGGPAEVAGESVTEPGDGVDAGSAGETGAADGAEAVTSPEDVAEAVEAFELSRRRVLTPLGRAQTAKRWYEGPRGPKSLSTKTAGGNLCSTCGFFVPLQGELNLMFGVCANKWSPDDGRVVSLDHGCGEHSEIGPPEPGRLWVQSKPAYDDLHIDVVAQAPREERVQVELIEEELDEEAAEATEADIEEQAVPASAVEDEDSAEPNADEPAVEAVIDLAENDSDETDDSGESDEPDGADGSGEPEESDGADGVDEAEASGEAGDSEDPGESENSEGADGNDEADDADASDESEESESETATETEDETAIPASS
ncbi:hypothetical protein BLEM_0855 [Bifidobacterium lemurum]|uniref:DUF3027 domain-containing protein n=1 Tax=Bifidobacterium lemurum TaxID=1603886 RepID=A0A261FT30_9BIFI|nr:DUF3027 domain-containing protein [Bifidobacterium lemurum]OZG62309.1 hypothetical protein BLEM_0855 [Bifidobacterium lemurum]QOL33674.1 DUF3027 domain-containing protein [Bifidobacterium lemurum]